MVGGQSSWGLVLLLLTLPISCHSRVLGSVGVPPLVSWDRPGVGAEEVPGTAPLLTRLAQVSSLWPRISTQTPTL